jgi:hypothetical protein
MDRPALVSEVGLTVVRPAVVLAKSPSTASARLSPQPSLSVWVLPPQWVETMSGARDEKERCPSVLVKRCPTLLGR